MMAVSDANLTADLAAFLRGRGAAVVGFADLAILPSEPRRGLPVGIVFGLPLDRRIAATLADGPTREYAAEYERLNAALDQIGEACAARLRQRGFSAEAQGGTVKVLDRAKLAVPLPHKTVATLAGVGWVGKCGLLVTESHGSAIRINSVLTDAVLETGTPITESRCGSCEQCREICPAHAPTGRLWRAGMPREELVDAFACLAAARNLSGAIGFAHPICGRCIAACPWTERWVRGEDRE